MSAVGWVNSVELAQAMATSDDRTQVLQVDVPARDFLLHRDAVEGRLGQVDSLLKPLGYVVKKVSALGGLTERFRWEPPQVPPSYVIKPHTWAEIDRRVIAAHMDPRSQRYARQQVEVISAQSTPMRILEAITGAAGADRDVLVHIGDLTWLYDQWQRLELEHGERLRNEVIKGVSEGT